jgi:RNA polymerase sigma-70 factor (ECF subfamily)
LDEAGDNFDGPEEMTDLEAEELMELVRNLPLGYRTVFNLYAIEGYSHQEIGAMLGISESTSKSQLNRARSVLKEKITSLQLQTKITHG